MTTFSCLHFFNNYELDYCPQMMDFGDVKVWFFLFFLKIFIYLPGPGLSCGMQDLAPQPGIKPMPLRFHAECKNSASEHLCKTETNSQTHKLVAARGGLEGQAKSMGFIHQLVHVKQIRPQGLTVQHGELHPLSSNHLKWGRICKNTESLCCTTETDTNLQVNCVSIKDK